jgi:arylformamidase
VKLHGDFDDQSEIDAAYDVFTVEPDASALLAGHGVLSRETRAEYPAFLDLHYGPTRDEYLDVYPAEEPGAPVLVFFHGGWWSLPVSGPDHALCARGPAAHGVTTVIVNYSLAPKVSVDEIVRQARSAVAWAYRNIDRYGGDPERIVVAGHSAGGQIVGMLAVTDWEQEYGLPPSVIKGGVALSGLFDLDVFRYSWLAPKLLLTAETVQRQSPIRHVRPGGIELVVAVGGRESAEFHRQSRRFVDAWAAADNPASLVDLDGHTHLTSYATYADADSELTLRTVDLIRRRATASSPRGAL